MSELKPCPFCKCEMQVKTVGRDWYRIEGDHKETCFFELDDNRLMVPQSDDQLAALLKDWDTRATPIPEIIEQVKALDDDTRKLMLELLDELDTYSLDPYLSRRSKEIVKILKEKLGLPKASQLLTIASLV